jgi:uncharacterized protein (TIGR00369 family)
MHLVHYDPAAGRNSGQLTNRNERQELMENEQGRTQPEVRGLLETLQMEIVERSPERVVVTMPVTPEHHQPMGFLHGGATVALAETAASIGGNVACPADSVAFGQEINANHLRPVREGLLTAVATPLHIGRTTQVWDIKIRDQAERLICVARCTVAVIPKQRIG